MYDIDEARADVDDGGTSIEVITLCCIGISTLRLI